MAQDKEKSNDELIAEIKSLLEKVARLESMKSLSREQKLKLLIFDRVPFTIWACDRNFKIVLWSGKSAEIYGYSEERALGVNYLELFVDPPERERSQEDCLKIIDEDMVSKNFLAYDQAQGRSRRTMLTNCFRIFDEQSNDYLQAEVALEISDLQLRLDEHRTLREVGIERLTQTKRTIEIIKRELTTRIDRVHSMKLDSIRHRREELEQYFDKIRATQGGRSASAVTNEDLQELEKTRRQLVDGCNNLRDKVQKATSIECLDQLTLEVIAIEKQSIFQGGPPSANGRENPDTQDAGMSHP